MSAERAKAGEQRATYLTLTGLFLTLFGIFAWREQKFGNKLELRPGDVLLLSLAAFRGGRLIAWDHVTEPIRAPFTHTVPDSSGAGDNVEARGSGAQLALGQLLSCPICSGTWVAAFLVYALRLFPGPARLLITILGAVGAAEVFNALAEALSWQAAKTRQETGRLMTAQVRQVEPVPERARAKF